MDQIRLPGLVDLSDLASTKIKPIIPLNHKYIGPGFDFLYTFIIKETNRIFYPGWVSMMGQITQLLFRSPTLECEDQVQDADRFRGMTSIRKRSHVSHII